MKKSLLVVLGLAMSQMSRAADEKIGNLILVKRTTMPTLAECLENLKPSGSEPTIKFSCEVKPKVEYEPYEKGLAENAIRSETVQIGTCLASFAGFGRGYYAMNIFHKNFETITMNYAKDCVTQAFKTKNLETPYEGFVYTLEK